jgi:hypothetical protein
MVSKRRRDAVDVTAFSVSCSRRGTSSRRCRARSRRPEALHDQVVVLAGLDERAVLAHARADLVPLGLVASSSAAIVSNSLQPSCMTSSTKASRVPEVGGGPNTWIGASGSDGSISRPVGVGVGDDLAVDLDLGGERLEDLRLGQVDVRAVTASGRSTGRRSRSGPR